MLAECLKIKSRSEEPFIKSVPGSTLVILFNFTHRRISITLHYPWIISLPSYQLTRLSGCLAERYAHAYIHSYSHTMHFQNLLFSWMNTTALLAVWCKPTCACFHSSFVLIVQIFHNHFHIIFLEMKIFKYYIK